MTNSLAAAPSARVGTPAAYRSTVVVLHAHPDDEAIFTGVSIRALADAGHRVVLVTATTGGAGEPRLDLGRESLAQRRLAELERAADLLGVQRLVPLGFDDSGAHRGPYASGTLGATSSSLVADRLTELVEAEGATAIVHYDDNGIYGHVDHVQVHRIGAEVVRRTGITGYEATVDAARLRRGPKHVLHSAAGDARVGVSRRQISLVVEADERQIALKREAMAVHASQIGPEWLGPDAEQFARAYAREWFVRRGPSGVLDQFAVVNGRTGTTRGDRTVRAPRTEEFVHA